MTDRDSGSADRGWVLVVCTGNVCRSPYMAGRLAQLVRGSGVDVGSAGTSALVDAPMDPGSSVLLDGHGVPVDGFAARQVTRDLIADADLVLGATRAHRGEVVRLHPQALRYTFTWADFGQLAAGLDPPSTGVPRDGQTWVAHVADVVASLRGSVPPRSKEEADIVDPFRQGPEAFAAMARGVEVYLSAIARVLTRP